MTERRRLTWPLAAALLAVVACRSQAAPGPATPAPTAERAPAPVEPAAEPHAAAVIAVHLEGAWLAVRGERLGLSAALAAERDAAFAAGPPQDGLWWDDQVGREVWGVWSELCSECHGGNRSLGKVLSFPPPPRGWTESDALFFARSRDPRAVFRVIAEGARSGKPGIKDMPAWRTRLSNEQMWGLVYFLRAASKKKGSDLHSSP